jgi:hypothetical protein
MRFGIAAPLFPPDCPEATLLVRFLVVAIPAILHLAAVVSVEMRVRARELARTAVLFTGKL